MASLSRILFPTDFSPEAQNALQHALMLAGIQDGEVIGQLVVGTTTGKVVSRTQRPLLTLRI